MLDQLTLLYWQPYTVYPAIHAGSSGFSVANASLQNLLRQLGELRLVRRYRQVQASNQVVGSEADRDGKDTSGAHLRVGGEVKVK